MRKNKKYSLISLIENYDRYVIKDPFEDFEKTIDKSLINSTEKKGGLEEFIESTLIKYRFSLNLKSKSNENPRSRARVIYVSPDELPSGIGWKVLGQYDSSNHTIYIANNLSPSTEEFVYYHEEAHSIGIYDEDQADNYAAAKVGYNLRYGMAA